MPGAAIAFIAADFLFGRTFGTILNIGVATFEAMALYLVVRWGIGDIFVRRLYGLEASRKKFVSPPEK